jgi:serine protease AprX
MSRRTSRLLALTCAAATATTAFAAGTPALGAAASTPAATTASAHPGQPGLQRLLATGTPTGRAIVTFDRKPTAAQVQALRGLGLQARPMKKLPMALVAGPATALAKAADIGRDVYPDERLRYDDTSSTDAMSSTPAAAGKLRAKGLTGKGVTVGIVDSGCDGTHPDLADHIVHNVTLLSPEYVNGGTQPTFPVPIDQGPYSNSDLGSGHGTHVAGIVAADGTSGKQFLGVAPDAELACFAIGAVITTTAVVTAYDYALSKPDMLGIDVFNNSWGNSFRQYDPADPVNVATKAVTDKGAVVVFSAGNSGDENAEASVSPFNQAPWVISVAAGSVRRERGSFSSNGLEFDNGSATPIGTDGHTVFLGDRVGNTQPDVMAPGVKISSSCAATGTVIRACPSHGNASASGTSMSGPHVAGAAAVLVQARKGIKPMKVQQALTATATPVQAAGKTLGSWQVGYGHVNLNKAVKLVSNKKHWKKKLKKAQRKADRRLLRQDAYTVARSDLWQEDAPPFTLGGSYSASHAVSVPSGVTALKVALVYPTPGTAGNFASFTATVKNAAGTVVGTTTTNLDYTTGIANVLVTGVQPGEYTVDVSGDYAASDPDTLDSDSVNGRVVFLQVAQLAAR